jgi:hypothetical protein
MQPIPAIMITRKDGDAIVQALSNNTAVVNVTLKPITDIVNPPANSPVLGQASWGKGASTSCSTSTVPTAGSIRCAAVAGRRRLVPVASGSRLTAPAAVAC